MRLEMKVVGSDLVNRALRKVPVNAATEIVDEMRGMKGLGVEWKKAIAKTFVGRRQGQKWVYSEKNTKKYNAIGHRITSGPLDRLSLTIWATDRAAIHEFGGLVSPQNRAFLWLPVGRMRSYTDLRRRLRPQDLVHSALQLIKLNDGRYFIVERRATEKQAARGESRDKFLFALKTQVRHVGNRLKFRATTATMRNRAVVRFERGLRRALKKFDEAA